MNSTESLAALKTATSFAILGDPIGNLSLGKGLLDGRPVHMALVENRIASGSLGVAECDKLASLFRIIATQKLPLILFLDSAGARLSQGLPALGAFRRMYRAAVEMAVSGAPVMVVLGANCFGGASMLAALASVRYFSDNTQFAMSGPAILAQAAGGSALDDMFRAIAQAAIGAESRVRRGLDNLPMTGKLAMPSTATDMTRHEELKAGLNSPVRPAEPLRRKDLDLLYPAGYEASESDGVLQGVARDGSGSIALLGLVNRKPLGAAQAWAFADRAWRLRNAPPKRLAVLVDCDAHSAQLDDERLMLSAYVADMARALHELATAGTTVETTVLGMLGGGAYVALAAPSARLNVIYGAHIQLLPGKAIASILGDTDDRKHEMADYIASGVADQQLKIGLIPS
jgi:hypothetical protein